MKHLIVMKFPKSERLYHFTSSLPFVVGHKYVVETDNGWNYHGAKLMVEDVVVNGFSKQATTSLVNGYDFTVVENALGC